MCFPIIWVAVKELSEVTMLKPHSPCCGSLHFVPQSATQQVRKCTKWLVSARSETDMKGDNREVSRPSDLVPAP